MLGWIIRLLVVMLLVRMVWKFLSGVVDGATRRPQVPPAQGVSLVRDPVCGIYVDQAHALTVKRRGEVHYFCSEDCRTAFQRAPA